MSTALAFLHDFLFVKKTVLPQKLHLLKHFISFKVSQYLGCAMSSILLTVLGQMLPTLADGSLVGALQQH
ncbi:unnamed protein product [Bubo scandiacus]